MYLIKERPLIRPWQGDIYKDVNVIRNAVYTLTSEGEKEWDIDEVSYNYIIILSQECDLEQDYINRIKIAGQYEQSKTVDDTVTHDKFIPMILMAPAYLAEVLRYGNHLIEYGQQMQKINRDDWGKIKRNDNKRYHYLNADIQKNIPEIVIDFKHFFTISRDIFYNRIMNNCYFSSLTLLYREELLQRFSNYFSRIGIPNNLEETKHLIDSLYSGVSSQKANQR